MAIHSIHDAIHRFEESQSKIKALNYATSMLFWDASTGAPKSGADARSKSIGTMSGFLYQLTVNEQIKEDLTLLMANLESLDEIKRVSVIEAKREYDKLTKIPMDEFQAYNELVSKSAMVWEEAKEKSDFKMFEPYLEKVINMLLKFADYRGFEGHPYNLYIDDFEPGMSVDQLNVFFDTLRARVVPLLQKIMDKKREIPTDFLKKNYPKDLQDQVSRQLLSLMKFDLERGLLKESVHPFTMGVDIDDVRLTTHYYENDLASAMLSTAHEGGHAIYEQNIDRKLQQTLLATGTSNGIHESQSRLYENNFCKSHAFISYFLPYLKSVFPEQLKEVGVETFYKGLNKVEPSLIRIEADELTYSLHIMIRYEIELGLIDGTIKVSELPSVWNQKVKDYLGIVPSNDAEGVLQDVHWSEGLFGYFPTYALGSAYAAQIAHYMGKEIDIEDCLSKGDFEPLTKWLNSKVHQYGALKKPNELIELITGERLNSKYYCDYLEEKFSKVYEL
ncbi:carboxypeptidase M32 [Fusibacter ferrireducens]|uniref:Metal-dependent carboxypeptidase n=1 Tax=Fusibacter ferrireducens TaxID=2785058 RepID=A0ABR9ZUI5_9FIRM|nr:carboxypeptidase M32 [Fusibacter ferrireducens]MBF4694122.1 carboxypeptidase M32 [Fusibacter ferrireducens]